MITLAAIIKDGEIYTGKRHAWIFWSKPIGFFKYGYVDQGFVTNTGSFVGRKEAAEIAFKCGQIDFLKDELFSEDIIYVTEEDIREAEAIRKNCCK